jgi:NADP-dependent 3-hydroxy acid dehydrogenase YdfG
MFNKKVVIITGAGRGIGRILAQKLGASGARVVLASRTYLELQTVAHEVEASGGQAIVHPCDVTDSLQMAQLVTEAKATYGQIDYVYHGAGVGILGSALDLTDTDFDRMLNTNLKGLFYLTRSAIPAMLTNPNNTGGHFIVPVGILGRHVMRNSAGYSASKFAVVGMLKALGEEFNKRGIRFTALYLGGVNTSFWDTIEMKVQRDKMLTPESAADAVIFALSAPSNVVVNELVMQPDSHQFI